MKHWRSCLRQTDIAAVRKLVTDTGLFSNAEIDIAGELVEETLARGSDSGYEFVFVEAADQLVAYSCYGPIPGTQSSYDLYWIAVTPQQQGKGLGKKLLQHTEKLVEAKKATQLYVETSGQVQYAPTRAFYEHMGYGLEAKLADFYSVGDDKYIYLKRFHNRV